jgi:hypothetical protein
MYQLPFRRRAFGRAHGKSGDAKVHTKVNLLSGCIAPIVMLRERYQGNIGGWLAGTGY